MIYSHSPILLSGIRAVPSKTTNDTILMWTINGTKFLKFAQAEGYVSLPLSLFIDLTSKYDAPSVVSTHSLNNTFRGKGYNDDDAYELASVMFA